MLYLWFILKHPDDFPDHYIVRRQVALEDEIVFEPIVCVCETLEEARESVPAGLARFRRHPEDEEYLVESWF